MATKSFNKNFKIDPKVADDFRNSLVSFPKESKEERINIRNKIHENNKKAENLLARFSSLHKI